MAIYSKQTGPGGYYLFEAATEIAMLEPPPRRLLRRLRRLSPPEGTDALLLERFVEQRDEPAFEELLRRHADLVMRVCRRRLGDTDAEDAFQAVFLVLARDAGRIIRRESLAGWLYRVATQVSFNLLRGRNRHRMSSLPNNIAGRPSGEPAADELRMILEAELAALPDRLRGPVVLCYLEGRSNSEAADLLGCPKGTVDSRLASARQRLQARLLRRGVAPAAGLALEALRPADSLAAPASLTRRTLEAVMLFARAGDIAGAAGAQVLSLVAGVAPMSHHRLLLIAAVSIVFAFGGVGIAVLNARGADEKPADKPVATAPPAAKPAEEAMVEVPAEQHGAPTARDIHRALQSPMKPKIEQSTELPLTSWLEQFRQNGVPFQFDEYGFKKDPPIRFFGDEAPRVKIPAMPEATLEQVMRAVLSQLSSEEPGDLLITWRVQNGALRLLRVPVESRGKPADGDIIALHVEEKPLAEVLHLLSARTGASVVLDVRQQEKAKTAVSGSFSDVRLMPALRVLCDMCDLQPVFVQGVFYVTSRENAERLRKEFPEPPEAKPMPKPKD